MANARTLPALLLLVCLAAATGLLRTSAAALQPSHPEVQFDIPAFPVEVSRPFSFGLRSLVADLTFLEAVQTNGARPTSVTLQAGRHDDLRLGRLLQYTTDLDPKFRGAYRFAASALPRHTSDGFAAGVFATEQLLLKGEAQRPDDWQIAFQLGFIESFYIGRMREAGEAMARAAKLEGAPRFLGLLATRLQADAGDLRTAELMAAEMEEQSTEDASRQTWHERLLDLRVERTLRQIEAAAAQYKSRTGVAASTPQELVTSGDLRELPPEPRGGRYGLRGAEAYSTATPRLRIRGRLGTQSGLIAQ